jgi:hypothetical protein
MESSFRFSLEFGVENLCRELRDLLACLFVPHLGFGSIFNLLSILMSSYYVDLRSDMWQTS